MILLNRIYVMLHFRIFKYSQRLNITLNFFVLIFFVTPIIQAQRSISIIFPPSLLDTSITAITINDVRELLFKACSCKVDFNNSNADVLIKLPEIDTNEANKLNRFAKKANFPYRNYPDHEYSWSVLIVPLANDANQTNRIILELTTKSLQGISFGLYGLLQEMLGFKFYHPKQMIIPSWDIFPLKENKHWKSLPLFDKKGFHLHTQHPIELTEQLLDANRENAIEDVKEYIDWLVRNGQNYFEFCLLESIDRDTWPEHIKIIVDYCHQRGILASVDVSLHMIQQKNFQLYQSYINKKKQIIKNLEWLMQVDWDFINMEFTMAEFLGGNKKKKEQMRLFIISWLKKNTNTKLMGRQHVVSEDKEIDPKKSGFKWDSISIALDKERGVLSHTVMFYDMTEPHAPVYENINQRHQFEFLLNQHKIRETWYYPESAYWVTFDNSIPMFLLPYLTARLSDIDTCVVYEIPGHITFSSGWEWGYWLFDWSIARWSWQHVEDGIAQNRFPEMYAHEILQNDNEKKFITYALQLQQQYLKDSMLIKWLTAMTIIDEMPSYLFNKEFQPRPQWSYKFIQRKADIDLIKHIRDSVVTPLLNFHRLNNQILSLINNTASINKSDIIKEFEDGVSITSLRAKHRAMVVQYILCKRESFLIRKKCDCDVYLNDAKQTREQALAIVKHRELHYRYPLELLAGKRFDHTAYHSGYLYTVSNLYFWKREEEQAKKNNYFPLFMSVWNMWRIIGLID